METSEFTPRPTQTRILQYRGGRMGISAVPGAGKTYILAVLAAQLIEQAIDQDQEVLVVTLVNSAVENIKNRIAGFVQQRGLLKGVGYRVRTLHGLAHDIVRARPGLVGLAEDFQIADERGAQEILERTVEMWLHSHPDAVDAFLADDVPSGKRDWVVRTRWPETVNSLATTFIKRAKDRRYTPQELVVRLEGREGQCPLARMAIEIYADYQSALQSRGFVDFDDLIRLAWLTLDLDTELLARLRHLWPFILEDEAQDSSELQEAILTRLSGPGGNWIRVGDPNQAINTTFTTADPRFLRQFLRAPGVVRQPMDESGRSQQCIVDLANYLVEWTMREHPAPAARQALEAPPLIRPTPPGDPQPNPPADPGAIHLSSRRLSPEAEVDLVVRSLKRWLRGHPNETVAVLVPRNQRGFQVTDALRKADIEVVELLRSTTSTRKTAGALGNVLNYLVKPSSPLLLARAFEVWRRHDRQVPELAARAKRLSTLIRRCTHVEQFIWPRFGRDWLDDLDREEAQERQQAADPDAPSPTSDRDLLDEFRSVVRLWQQAIVLPVDQLVLTIAQELFTEPAELALAHKLAVMLRTASENNPDWRLQELTAELAVIARNQRRFLGFSSEDVGYVAKPGTVTVSTLHKAKGLEWDRVYLLSVNNYNFPSGEPYDDYISERWFIRDRLNLEAEALEQLRVLVEGGTYLPHRATEQARRDYVAERLRLLYVGITRARKELIITWNTGRGRESRHMAVPFIALETWWNAQRTQRSL